MKEYDMEDELAKLEYQAVLPVTKDHWVPTAEEVAELSAMTKDVLCRYRERALFALWAERRSVENH